MSTAAAAGHHSDLELSIGPHADGELAVLEARVDEELSRPFRAEITAIVRPGVDVDAAALLGQEARLALPLADGHRPVHGIVAEVETWEEGRGPEARRLRAIVVPAAWRLSQSRRSRIFQGLSAPEIVQKVVGDEGGVALRHALTRSYAVREYCVQHQESDLDFVSRLLEDEGIFYYFEHAPDRHTLVLADDSAALPELAGGGTLPYRDAAGMSADPDHVDAFAVSAELRPGAVALRDYAWEHPTLDLTAVATADGADPALEVYEYPGGYAEDAAGRARSRLRLEEVRATARSAAGSSPCPRVAAGAVLELEGHPVPELDGAWAVLAVTHEARRPQALSGARSSAGPAYRNRFRCIPRDVPFRPPRRTPRPSVAGAQTARVVGPDGEEIHVDAHGRVKVQFHWDREGRRDDRSSCWIRVAQAWAGAGWGALYLPRVGQEVVVEFLDGDPDRPLVTGAVYNGENPPPVALPDEKTRSTLRSASSPGGDGANELRFEDAAGSEEVYLHAQRDLEVLVEHDRTERVGGDETLEVAGDRRRRVRGRHAMEVARDDRITVGGSQSLEVGGARSVTVGGVHAETVGGSQTVQVGGAYTLQVGLAAAETVGLAKILTVGGAYAVNVGAAMNELVGGLRSEEIGGAKVELVGAQKTETVAGDREVHVGGELTETVGKKRTVTVGGDLTVQVEGSLSQQAKGEAALVAKEIRLTAEERLSLSVGDAVVAIDKDGNVSVNGKQVELAATGELVLKAPKIQEN